MGLFKKNREDIENLNDGLKDIGEEWVWVDGFKGTDKDMKCRDFQFELDKQFDISDDKKVEVCEHGFHMCLKLHHVHGYYAVCGGNRFFEVKALVRKKDLADYGKHEVNSYFMYSREIDKLAAKSIIFTRELTLDEIFSPYSNMCSEWSDDDKRLALEIGIDEARGVINLRNLTSVGYSETFAKMLIKARKYDIAYAVGSQEDLSMDMKVWTIFNGK